MIATTVAIRYTVLTQMLIWITHVTIVVRLCLSVLMLPVTMITTAISAVRKGSLLVSMTITITFVTSVA